MAFPNGMMPSRMINAPRALQRLCFTDAVLTTIYYRRYDSAVGICTAHRVQRSSSSASDEHRP